jgi:hypothetical protein
MVKVAAEFNKRIPKDQKKNLRWRQKALARALDDVEYADALRQACMQDPLFFLNGFGWTYDPRRTPFPKLPFILYDFQEDAILEIVRAIGSHDLLIEKSRDMGASWIVASAIVWMWLYRPMQSFLFVSRTEGYVDDAGNPKSIFWKVDYLIANLPDWLKPKGYKPSEHRRKLHIENPENGSVIDGESTTGNVARGDRRTAILLDEFAAVEQGHRVLSSTRDATNCRIFNSTPAGTNNAFYDMTRTSIRKLRLHWSVHPLKSKGLYTTDDDGFLKVLDEALYPEGYTPILDGKLRSPWYDTECSRCANSQEIAQELDIDYLGSGYQYFNAALVQEAIREHARPPVLAGDLDFDILTAEPTEFRENAEGRLSLWFYLDREGKPPSDHKIVLGIDISAGSGSSNSVISGWDAVTKEKVLEYKNPFIRPESLAYQAVAIAQWCYNAFMAWEKNGPGGQFGSRVLELRYGNVYYRRRHESISKEVTDSPGWASTRETKMLLLGAYRAAIEKKLAVNRSKGSLEECLEYIFTPDGSIEHSRSTQKVDPSGAKDNHGDAVIADALAWLGMDERKQREEAEEPTIPVGSLAWRNQMRAKEKQPANRELDSSWRA